MDEFVDVPRTLLFDTTVLLRALGDRPDESDSPACRRLWEFCRDSGRRILVAAPSVTEILRFPTAAKLPVEKSVVVVPVDYRTAEIAAEICGVEEVRAAPDATRRCLKFDSLIVAAAIRNRAECVITLDDGMLHRYKPDKHPMSFRRPREFEHPQAALLQPLPAPNLQE